MAKVLIVTEPFMGLEKDDEFVWDGQFYVAQQDDEYMKHDESGDTFQASFQASCKLSKEYANALIEQGYLTTPCDSCTDEKSFVNVFDEIDNLIGKYNEALKETNKEEHPAIRHEQETVYLNMIKVLEHLKGLKK